MTHIYLVRHGETDWNLRHRIQGSTDIPLNDAGRAQAARAGRLLARRSWDAIYSSPLSRAMETATIISSTVGLGQPLAVDALVERGYGDAEGMTDHEIRSRFPGSMPVPGREPRGEVAARVMPALVSLAEHHVGEHLIVATHGAVIRTVLLSLKAPVRAGIAITNGSIHSFRHARGMLELIEFDDPIEIASIVAGDEDIVQQNPLEKRE
ncbi:MAG: histidine phosphatase family protein [Terrimesophilobacter sp.]